MPRVSNSSCPASRKRQPNKNNKASNYINNEELYDIIVKWKAEGAGKIPDKLAMAFLQICNNLARSTRFSGYTWKDEMIEDALYYSVRFCRNFDPEKSKNPFSYFSQVAWNAFIHRIKLEKERISTLNEYREEVGILYNTEDFLGEGTPDEYQQIDNTAKNLNAAFKKPKEKKKPFKREPKHKKPTIDDFLG